MSLRYRGSTVIGIICFLTHLKIIVDKLHKSILGNRLVCDLLSKNLV